MNDLEKRCLDTFPEWLKTLADDTSALSDALARTEAPENARRLIAGALNYLFKSLDLIPDGIEDLGFLDDAFVLRIASKLALAEWPEAPAAISELASEAELVESLLGPDYARLLQYVGGLVHGAARGRTTDDIVADNAVREAFASDLGSWAASYTPPGFSRDEKNLVKLTSFLSSKLPA